MPTVLFDFDSTLIDCESLDEMLARVLAGRADLEARVRAITVDGMEGRIGFRESVERRLALARPTRAQAEAFGREALGRLTPGMARLVRGLPADVWIVSGALLETMLPVAGELGIPAARVVGTEVRWSAAGELLALARCGSKVDAVRGLCGSWPRPRISVGDGMTDYALLESGCVDHFLAFTLHVRRESVLATGVAAADCVERLQYLLEQLL